MRHAILGVAALLPPAAGIVLLNSDDTVWKLSVTAGWSSLVLIATTLGLGPVNVIRGQANPVSFDLRRDVGIWAAVLAVAHSVVGLFVHFRGRPWTYFVWPADRAAAISLRYDLFGAAAWSGLAATLLIVALGAVSNDLALRRLGTGRWKNLQRTNYVLFGLVAIHGLAFQVLEKREFGLMIVLGGLVVVTATMQWLGLAAYRRARGTRAGARARTRAARAP